LLVRDCRCQSKKEWTVNLSLCLTKHHSMKTYGGVDV
jgi:hypothetical protein